MKERWGAAIVVSVFMIGLIAVSIASVQQKNKRESADSEGNGKEGHYTFSYQSDAIDNWNPLLADSKDQKDIVSLMTTPLYGFSWNEEAGASVLEPLLAESEPKDVTKAYAGKSGYGVPSDAGKNYAWTVLIREDVLWQDGSPVTAEDFAFTMEKLLEPDTDHRAAEPFVNGTLSLANANAYHNNVRPAYREGKEESGVSEKKLLFSLSEPLPFLGGCSLEEYYAYHSVDEPDRFRNARGIDLYKELKTLAGGDRYVSVDEKIQNRLGGICKNLGEERESYWKLCFYEEKPIAFGKVGFVADSEREMTFIFSQPVSKNALIYALTDFYTLKKDLYQSDPEAYGTDSASSCSYGPYKVVSKKNKQGIDLECNDLWFGYSQELFAGQYQTTDIHISFGEEKQEALSKYEMTALSDEELSQKENARNESGTSSGMYLLNSDITALDEENKENENHTILGYPDFRNAVSLMLDRKNYLSEMNVSGAESPGIFNDAYDWDAGKQENYRSLPEAQKVLDDVYGKDRKVYDPKEAAKKLCSAYNICLADGNIKDTDKICLTFDAAAAEADIKKEAAFLQKAFDAISAGTALEKRIVIKPLSAKDNEQGVRADICKITWSGNGRNIIDSMGDWCKGKSLVSGICPSAAGIAMTIGEERVTNSYSGWYDSLIIGEYKNASAKVRKQIFCNLERMLLKSYAVIPLYQKVTGVEYDGNIIPGQNYLNAQDGYGGLRYLRYKKDDAEK